MLAEYENRWSFKSQFMKSFHHKWCLFSNEANAFWCSCALFLEGVTSYFPGVPCVALWVWRLHFGHWCWLRIPSWRLRSTGCLCCHNSPCWRDLIRNLPQTKRKAMLWRDKRYKNKANHSCGVCRLCFEGKVSLWLNGCELNEFSDFMLYTFTCYTMSSNKSFFFVRILKMKESMNQKCSNTISTQLTLHCLHL